MAAYIIGLRRSESRGTAWGEEYRPKTAALIAKHGGKVLIGGNSPRALMALEGEAKPPLSVVILEFPSLEHAQAFHNDPDYAPLKQLRQASIDIGGLRRRAGVSTSRRGRFAPVTRHAVGCPPGMTSILLHKP